VGALGRRLKRRLPGAWQGPAILAAVLLASAAFALLLLAHGRAGLVPQAQAWSATVAGLLGAQGLHGLLVLVLAAWLLARSRAALLAPRQRASFDNAALLWHGSMVHGLVVSWAPQVVAWWVGR